MTSFPGSCLWSIQYNTHCLYLNQGTICITWAMSPLYTHLNPYSWGWSTVICPVCICHCQSTSVSLMQVGLPEFMLGWQIHLIAPLPQAYAGVSSTERGCPTTPTGGANPGLIALGKPNARLGMLALGRCATQLLVVPKPSHRSGPCHGGRPALNGLPSGNLLPAPTPTISLSTWSQCPPRQSSAGL